MNPSVHALRPVGTTKRSSKSNYASSNSKNDKIRSILKNAKRTPNDKICGFCDEPGHTNDSCIKRGPDFWPDWHSKKVAQYNAQHGDKPKKSPDQTPTPPPPTASFHSNTSDRVVKNIQTTIEDVSQQLLDQLNDGMDGNELLHHAIAVRHQEITQDQQDSSESNVIQDQFDAKSETDSVFALDSETSSNVDYDDLEIYDQSVN